MLGANTMLISRGNFSADAFEILTMEDEVAVLIFKDALI